MRHWQDQHVQLCQDVRKILDGAQEAKRDLTADEGQKIDAMFADIEKLAAQIKLAERAAAAQGAVKAAADPANPVMLAAAGANKPDEYRAAFDSFIRRGERGLTEIEKRQLLSGSGGGANLVPTVLYNEIVAALSALVPMRRLARVIKGSARTDIPLSTAPPTAAFVAENAAATPSTPTLSNRALRARKMVTIAQASEELLQDSAFDVESYLTAQIMEAFALEEDRAFYVGNGTTEPAGLVPAVTVGATAPNNSSLTGDNLIDVFYALPAQYHPRAVWSMRGTTMSFIAKLKDTQNRFLWMPPFGSGAMSTILGRPIELDENVPAIGASARSVVFFDPKLYLILDAQEIRIERLEEIYIVNGLKAFRATARVDGAFPIAAAGRALVHPV